LVAGGHPVRPWAVPAAKSGAKWLEDTLAKQALPGKAARNQRWEAVQGALVSEEPPSAARPQVGQRARMAARLSEARVQAAEARVQAAEARMQAVEARVQAAEARVQAAEARVQAAARIASSLASEA